MAGPFRACISPSFTLEGDPIRVVTRRSDDDALCRRMIAAMQMRGFSPRTYASYLAAVRALARFTRRSPDTLGRTDR